jgi:hypothetical protein
MRFLLVFISFFAACEGAMDKAPRAEDVPAMVVAVNAPVDLPRPNRTASGVWTSPSALWLQAGKVTVLDGALVRQKREADFVTVPVGVESEASVPGVVKAVSRRGNGVMLAASAGLFHDAPGRLLRSPVSDAFSQETLRFIDVVGKALWVTTATQAVRVLDGQRETVLLNDAANTGTVQVVVGRSPTSALLVKGSSLYAVDLAAKTVKTLARGLGTVTALDHRGEVALLGTSEGLIEVGVDDVVTRHTLTATPDVPQAIVDIEVVGNTTLVTTPSQVLQLGTVAIVLADVTQPWPDSLTKDSSGDVWFIDGSALVRLSRSMVALPSFAADVRPFMTAHCRSCHATGANYAPQLNLETYAVAKSWAARSLTRLTDTLAPMPPVNTEVLTPAQYDVVVRWVEGGLLP